MLALRSFGKITLKAAPTTLLQSTAGALRTMQQRHDRSRGYRPANRGGARRAPNYDPNVPRVNQVVPGATVSIVLKADQPTGHEVQGTVQDLLTRGDHPRGIKVRLVDGRVGRVQRMAPTYDESSAVQVSSGLDGAYGREDLRSERGGHRSQGRGRGRAQPQPPKYQDVRDDDYTYTEEHREQGNSLAVYLDAFERRQAAGARRHAPQTPADDFTASLVEPEIPADQDSTASQIAPATVT